MTSFKVGPLSTTHRLYICNKVDRIYFSKDACTAVGILPKSFPFPMQPNIASEKPDKPTMNAVQARTGEQHTTSQRVRLPYPPKEENIGKMKDSLIKSFPSVFNRSTPFQTMKCKPAHIHVKKMPRHR